MTARKPRLPSMKMVTPTGLSHFAYINKPDTEGTYADGKYKITVSFPADHEFVGRLNAAVSKLMAEHFGSVPAGANNPVKEGKADSALEGRVFIRAKSNNAPIAVDSQKKALTGGVTVFGGDTVKAAITLAVYDTGAAKGVTAYLDAVQLIEKRNAGSAAVDMFGVEDGFTTDSVEVSADSFDDDDDL